MVGTITGLHAGGYGYYASDVPRVEGWTPVDRLEVEGWAADVLARGH